MNINCLSFLQLISIQEHEGRLHFGTDAWTSPNHRAFVAWTVQLPFEGTNLVFLLDIIEVPKVYSNHVPLHVI
jgi:hypothetical protein